MIDWNKIDAGAVVLMAGHLIEHHGVPPFAVNEQLRALSEIGAGWANSFEYAIYARAMGWA